MIYCSAYWTGFLVTSWYAFRRRKKLCHWWDIEIQIRELKFVSCKNTLVWLLILNLNPILKVERGKKPCLAALSPASKTLMNSFSRLETFCSASSCMNHCWIHSFHVSIKRYCFPFHSFTVLVVQNITNWEHKLDGLTFEQFLCWLEYANDFFLLKNVLLYSCLNEKI